MKNIKLKLVALAAGIALALPVASLADAFKSDRIVVTVKGEGPDVVLIPGLSSSAEIWDTTVAAVPGYRYHVIQVKGFAGVPAEANASGPVVVPVANEVARYIRDEKLDQPSVVGHSMGGSVGMILTARNPGLVSRLMVVDMMPFMGVQFAPNATPESVAPMAAQIRDGITHAPPAVRQSMTEQTIAGMVKTKSFHAASMTYALSSDPVTSGQAMYDLITTDLTTELSRITVPFRVLWVVPANSPVSAEQMGEYYRLSYRNAPNVTIREVKDSYHFIMFDQPEVFQTELKAFLK